VLRGAGEGEEHRRQNRPPKASSTQAGEFVCHIKMMWVVREVSRSRLEEGVCRAIFLFFFFIFFGGGS
jgi:hypothetical protein